MSNHFSSVITPTSIIFSTPEGKMVNVTNTHVNFDQLKSTLKELQIAKRDNNDFLSEQLHRELAKLAEPARVIIAAGKGKVTVVDGVVLYEGEEVHNAVTGRILWGLKEGFDMQPYILFLENLMKNPSKRAVDELFGFIEANGMGITEDGCLTAYKRVRNDYHDIHSGRFDNSVGSILEMPRNRVDDDRNKTCSYGFHFCSFAYLPSFGSGQGDKVMIVKVDPADVVSIPADYDNAKARCCKYEVIGEYTGADLETILGRDVLASKPVWALSDWRTTSTSAIDDDADVCDSDDDDCDYDADADDADDCSDDRTVIERIDAIISEGGSFVHAVTTYTRDGKLVEAVVSLTSCLPGVEFKFEVTEQDDLDEIEYLIEDHDPKIEMRLR